jgi:hypothetical protein
MDMVQHRIKEILTKELETCRNTWLISARELQEVLISMAGDLAIEERHLTKRAADWLDSPEKLASLAQPANR